MAERNGTERAAILLLALGEQEAAEVLKLMDAKEVQRVGAAMANLTGVSREEVHGVLSDFGTLAEDQTSVGIGAEDFLRKVLVTALGEGKAASVIDRINIGRPSKGLDALKWMDARSVADLIRQEHPQIIAIILAYLDPDQAAGVLQELPANTRSEIVMRIASLDGVQPFALSELDDVIEKQFAGRSTGKTSTLGGAKAAANIINFLGPSQEGPLMEEITKADEALGTKIQDLIFVFDNLLELDDRGMQELLRQVPGDKLILALKGADESIKAKIFKNMSQRAGDTMREDLESRGPVKLSEVEAAQKEILTIARKLAEEGTIQLAGSGEEYV